MKLVPLYTPASSQKFAAGDDVQIIYTVPRSEWWAKILRRGGVKLKETHTVVGKITSVMSGRLIVEDVKW